MMHRNESRIFVSLPMLESFSLNNERACLPGRFPPALAALIKTNEDYVKA